MPCINLRLEDSLMNMRTSPAVDISNSSGEITGTSNYSYMYKQIQIQKVENSGTIIYSYMYKELQKLNLQIQLQ